MMVKATFLGISGGGAAPNNAEQTTARGCYIDVQRRTATFAMPTAQTPFIWDTEVTDTDNIYNPATGVLTLPFTGKFDFEFMFNVDVTSGTHQLISAAELWNGSAWVKSEYSARQVAVRTGENSQALFSSTNRFVAGTQLRFPTWASGSGVSLQTEVPTNGTGFTVPAARLLMTGVRTN